MGSPRAWLNVTPAVLLGAMLPTFAVVRNPFARAVSMWAWQTCKGSTTCGRDSITASAFQLWVRQTVSVWAADAANPARWSWWYRPQADYVLGPDLECAVTHILPFERLKASYAALARLYPKLAPLPERGSERRDSGPDPPTDPLSLSPALIEPKSESSVRPAAPAALGVPGGLTCTEFSST